MRLLAERQGVEIFLPAFLRTIRLWYFLQIHPALHHQGDYTHLSMALDMNSLSLSTRITSGGPLVNFKHPRIATIGSPLIFLVIPGNTYFMDRLTLQGGG